MSEHGMPISEPSYPPEARVGRAYIDAVMDGLQNILAMVGIFYAWLFKEALSMEVALSALAVVLGFLNAGQIVDRFTTGRAPRAPLTVLVGMLGGSKAAGLAGLAEAARRTFLGLTLIAILPIVITVQACATLKSLNDAALEFCESTMGAEAARQGITVQELCLVPSILEPFLSAPRDATSISRQHAPPMGDEPTEGGEAP